MSHLTAVSLFAGAVDGIGIAFEQAGALVTHHVEWDAWCCDVLAQNFPQSIVINEDVNHVDGSQFAGTDIIFGGPPCQGFSFAGKQLGLLDDRYLWPAMFEIVRAARPRAVIVENVSGSVSGGLVDAVCTDLEAAGYTCSAFLVPASAIGAPHERYRVFIVGIMVNTAEPRLAHWQPANQRPNRAKTASWLQPKSKRSSFAMVNTRSAGRKKPNATRQPARARHTARRSAQKRSRGVSQSRLGRAAHGAARRLDVSSFPGWPAGQGVYQHHYEPPRTTTRKTQDHKQRIQALGNAVVWQQVYPIARALVEWLQTQDEATS